MMIVPRAFAHHTRSLSRSNSLDEKRPATITKRPSSITRQKSGISSSLESLQKPTQQDEPTTRPVTIQRQSTGSSVTSSGRSTPTTNDSVPNNKWPLAQPKRRESAQELLTATAIPIRRKPKVRSTQRLPNGDFVADFTKHLRDDLVADNTRGISRSVSNSNIESLFGSISGLVDGQMFVGSEGLDAGILTSRSLSTESILSMGSPDDYSTSDLLSPPSSFNRSPTSRRNRQYVIAATSTDHPLQETEVSAELKGSVPELAFSPPRQPKRRPQATDNRPGSFKSSLTASLRALKSAAQSVSTLATFPTVPHPDDFNNRSLFEINPALTDDKRPPPSDEPPSPALRRYLNPYTSSAPDSPTQLHFWVDDKSTTEAKKSDSLLKPKQKSRRKFGKKGADHVSQLPTVVPLATCIPSPIRTPHASSPPVWLAPDGTPSNRQTGLLSFTGLLDGQTRPREPRENRDFLRMYVGEMNMRKAGKLSETVPLKASLWLPPVQDSFEGQAVNGVKRRRIREDRWQSLASDEL